MKKRKALRDQYEMAQVRPKTVLLWTALRSISTAFERSIITLSNVKVIHEPFDDVFYLGPERQSNRYASRPIKTDQTYKEAGRKITKEYEGKEVVFSKNMAHYVENKFEMFLEPQYKCTQHTFLVRNPEESIPALYRASKDPKIVSAGWNYFDPEEAGFRQMYELYHFIVENVHPSPVLIDADDLLDHPDETMKTYCDAVGITYQSHMTSWEPGPVAEYAHCAGLWHQNVIKSYGFNAKKTKADDCTMPDEVRKAITDAKPYYEFLKAKKLKINIY
ncbi:branched-chain-amino-acid aminotransferase-like protein 2 [Actinia tenebrosa]|uniref:Branched-chain-amino-acid aminotransferase-like protein 2 n=1 Tax=Actinia tenebrosa TaxID=6105 RepID=A0A6P8JAK4_ACTTE|nr:branched-chain-amino-acid aminotransferase-like protein 2 [Actinia tenebrosa]